MMRSHMVAIAAALSTMFPAGVSGSCAEDAMIVFDGSGSMSEMGFNMLDEPRISEARRAMHRAIPDITPHRRVGLMIYGPGERGTCQNIELLFAPKDDAAGDILSAIDVLEPSGDTPLTASVFGAAEALEFRTQPGVIVVITDGNENCGGAPCDLATLLATKSHSLTVHVIGFKVRGGHFNWSTTGSVDYTRGTMVARCLADMTGGLYVRTETVEELVMALEQTLGCPLFGQVQTPGRQRFVQVN